MAKSSKASSHSSSRPSGSSSSAVSLNRLRSLCTAAEQKLLDISESSGLAKAAHTEVQSLLSRARQARDKWRALVGGQTRAAKRSPRAVAEANARSHAKAQLFDGAVKRFEARLATLSSAMADVARSAVKPVAALVKKPKHSRVAGHRKARAGLRAEMAGKVATMNLAGAKAVAKPVVSKPVVMKPAVMKPAAAVATPVVVKAVAAPKAASKKRKQPPAKAAAAQAIRFDAAKQRSARTAAKNSRLKMEGLATRRASHTIAAGKRSQARRDKRR